MRLAITEKNGAVLLIAKDDIVEGELVRIGDSELRVLSTPVMRGKIIFRHSENTDNPASSSSESAATDQG